MPRKREAAPAELSKVGEANEVLGDLTVTEPLQPAEDRKALAQRLTQEIKDDLRRAIGKLWRVEKEKLWQELGEGFAN
jgi:hypothetical protein